MEGEAVSIQRAATDADDAADALACTLVSGPAGAMVSAGGLLQWTAAGVGDRTFTVRVTDPDGAFSERNFTIAVQAVPNAAPVLASVPTQSVTLGEELALALSATHADDAADALVSTLVSGPDGATVSARSEEHTPELQSLMSISYAVCCLKKKKHK